MTLALTRFAGLVVSNVVTGLLVSPAFATQYDVRNDFSPAQNPNGVWSYGYSAALAGPFSLCTEIYEDSNQEFWYKAGGTPRYYPDCGRLPRGLSGNFTMTPSGADEYAIVRWTAPFRARIQVAGHFRGYWPTLADGDVHILHAGVSLFSSAIQPSGQPPVNFALTRNIESGETIDFCIGVGANGSYDRDRAILVAQVTALPQGDLNEDCRVDLADLSTLLARFGTPDGAAPADGDIDGDGDVDLSDLSQLLANFGSACP
jgi:hypothetical protein